MSTVTLGFRAGWLFVCLLALYLLVYSGRFHSIDEVSSVALADSLWLQGQPTTDQIGWSQSWSLPQGTYGLDGHLYSKKGIGYSVLLLPFQWFARQVQEVGIVGSAHLLNALITALTGVWLYILGVQVIGQSGQKPPARALMWMVLAWGVGTFALVYSKYLFNSPIVGLCVVGTVSLLFYSQNRVTTRKFALWLALFIAGVSAGVALLARAENALIMPVLGLYILVTPVSYWQRFLRLLCFGIPIALTVAFLFYLNWTRFGDPLNFGYDLSQEANGNIALGLAGFLVSPGRSLLFMMPLLIPALWGWVRLARSAPSLKALGWLLIGLTIVYALFFARSADWWGGWNWGIRYFIPLLPLWVLGLLGVYDIAFNLSRHRVAGGLIWLTILLSVAIQILGVLVDFNRPLLADAAANVPLSAQLWGWEHAQIISHLRLIGDWQQWDVLAVAVQTWEIAWQPVALLIIGALGLVNAHMLTPNPFYQYALPFLLFSQMWWAALPLQHAAWRDPVWSSRHADLLPLNERLQQVPDGSVMLFEMLLYRPYFDRAQTWLNLGTNRVPHLQLIQENDAPAPQQRLRELAVENAERVFVATEATAIGDPNSATERWMSTRAHYAGTEWVGDETRLTTFYMPRPLSLRLPTLNFSDNLSLREAGIETKVAANTPLLLELVWGATGTPLKDYTVFVQLLRPDGTVALQQDSAPQGGFAPTSQWQAGAVVADRRALLLPADLAAGDYTLIAGLYDQQGVRLGVATGGDFVTLGVVTVEAATP
jgi:hypothetical protein